MIALPKFESRAMESVGAGLGDVVNDATHVTPIFSVEIRHHLQFCNGVLVAKKDRRTADGVVIVILPVQLIVVRASALAVDRNSAPLLLLKAPLPAVETPGVNSTKES